jgi:predicted dehydrogenase
MTAKNVGFVGFGFIGKVHAHGYLNLPLFYQALPFRPVLTHVCTSRLETAQAGAALIGAPHAVTDYREITENPSIDIVHICTPNHLHKDAILSAMAHGKHIYCDKPLTATLEEAHAIRAALPSYRGTAQMTLQNRFFPATIRARQLVDEGFLGRVFEFRCCCLHAGSVDPDAPLKWKLSAAAGGGVIADLASHVLDLTHFLLGDYQSLLACTSTAYSDRPAPDGSGRKVPADAEDCVMLLARMANGALGNIEATKIATGSEDEMRFEIHGSAGALRYNGMDPHHLDVWDQRTPSSPLGGSRGWIRVDCGQRYPSPANGFPTPKAAIGWMRGHMACLANFLFDIAAGQTGNPGLEQGVYIQHLMECCRRSAEDGVWTTV